MNSPSEDVKDILESISSLALTFKTDLFTAEMPGTPDQCVCVYDSGGFEPLKTDYERPTVQIKVRGTKNGYTAAYALAKSIKDELTGYANQTVNATRYISIWPMGDILSLGKDDNGRPQFTVNFEIHRT